MKLLVFVGGGGRQAKVGGEVGERGEEGAAVRVGFDDGGGGDGGLMDGGARGGAGGWLEGGDVVGGLLSGDGGM